jgi:hypothetical protein
MSPFHPRIRALAVGASAIALVAIGVGGTVAASNPATLYACYDVNGNVRMSDSAICKLPGGGRLASWGTTGVPGPTGLTGATGPTGATGAQGPAGAGSGTTLYHVAFGTTTTVLTLPWLTVGIHCQSSVSRDVTLTVPAGVTASLAANLIQYDNSTTPNRFYTGSIGLPVGNSFNPVLYSRVDAIISNDALPTQGVHVIAAYIGDDLTGCDVTVTE